MKELEKTYKCYRCGRELECYAVCPCHFETMVVTCGICGEKISVIDHYKCKCKIIRGID